MRKPPRAPQLEETPETPPSSRAEGALLNKYNLAHVIYGYRAHGEDIQTGWENEMLKFPDDDSFALHVDKMQEEIEGLEMIFAVHKR